MRSLIEATTQVLAWALFAFISVFCLANSLRIASIIAAAR
jgi:hypothetical protein